VRLCAGVGLAGQDGEVHFDFFGGDNADLQMDPDLQNLISPTESPGGGVGGGACQHAEVVHTSLVVDNVFFEYIF